MGPAARESSIIRPARSVIGWGPVFTWTRCGLWSHERRPQPASAVWSERSSCCRCAGFYATKSGHVIKTPPRWLSTKTPRRHDEHRTQRVQWLWAPVPGNCCSATSHFTNDCSAGGCVRQSGFRQINSAPRLKFPQSRKRMIILHTFCDYRSFTSRLTPASFPTFTSRSVVADSW